MAIELTIKNYRCFSDERPARITIRKGFTAFVGINNSGKSSLLKFFYEFRNLFQILSQPDTNFMEALRLNRRAFNLMPTVSDPNEVFCNANARDLEIDLHFTPVTDARPRKPERLVLTIPRGTNEWVARLRILGSELKLDTQPARFDDSLLRLGDTHVADLSDLFRECRNLVSTVYVAAFRNALNLGTRDDYFDIKVGQSFIKEWRSHKTGNVKQQNEAIYKLTNDIKGLFDFDSLEINPADQDQTLQVFVNGKSFKLSELGSGITQFILVLANVAIEQPTYILIDEPELNLHPSSQLDFLTTLGSYAREAVLFATHSIGLARASAESIYSVRRADGASHVMPYEATPNLVEFLGELGFSGYSELGFNKILLVEGATDVTTIQQLLRLYGKDHQVVLLHLGGEALINESSEVQLQEIKRISQSIFALIDSERAAPGASLSPARTAFVEGCRKTGIQCHVLDRRAIENYFPDHAVKKVKSEKYRALAPHESLRETQYGWAKAENWRIAREMTKQDLEGTDLCAFLERL